MENILETSNRYVLEVIKETFDSSLTYHNYDHIRLVFNAAKELGIEADLNEEEHTILLLGALFHDIGYGQGAENHEARSSQMAKDFLEKQNVDRSIITRVQKIIESTKLSWIGVDQLAVLLRDADLSHLASPEYMEICESLRLENSHQEGREITKEEWAKINIDFYKAHSYESKAGKKLYDKDKKKNLSTLKKAVEPSVEKKKQIDSNDQTIASSKLAQTQIKTALRNHIDLSAIADNKANIMLTVNAMVLTVGLPLLLTSIQSFPSLLLPTLMLAVTSILSMTYATLATRPIKMNGITDISEISKFKTNLFFFGNYYKMSFDEYEEGLEEVIANDKILNNSISRDLFFLGKSLGKKYELLKTCYNIFMVGVALAIIIGFISLYFSDNFTTR